MANFAARIAAALKRRDDRREMAMILALNTAFAEANGTEGHEDDHDCEECDFCDRPWRFRIRYPGQSALWLCKQCAEEMPVDYRPYVEVAQPALRGEGE